MAIKSNPAKARRKSAPAVDQAAASFIGGAPDDARPTDDQDAPTGKQVVVMKMPAALVKRIDAQAKRKGISRTAWITDRATTALEAEE